MGAEEEEDDEADEEEEEGKTADEDEPATKEAGNVELKLEIFDEETVVSFATAVASE